MTVSGQLTKSLHTVTAVVQVAMHLNTVPYPSAQMRDEQLVQAALQVLGHPGYTKHDPTVSKCIVAVGKALGR